MEGRIMSNVPPGIKHELRRSVAFVAVIDMWSAFDGFQEETADEYLQPHRETIAQILEDYPSLNPTLDENPAEVIEDDLKVSGLLDEAPIEEALETTREFYEQEDVLPIELK